MANLIGVGDLFGKFMACGLNTHCYQAQQSEAATGGAKAAAQAAVAAEKEKTKQLNIQLAAYKEQAKNSPFANLDLAKFFREHKTLVLGGAGVLALLVILKE